jgi:hypothetical protein
VFKLDISQEDKFISPSVQGVSEQFSKERLERSVFQGGAGGVGFHREGRKGYFFSRGWGVFIFDFCYLYLREG